VDLHLLLGLAASSASDQHALAATLVNRLRLSVAAQRFEKRHPSCQTPAPDRSPYPASSTQAAFDAGQGATAGGAAAAPCGHPCVLSLRQEPGPPGSAHRARILMGLFGRAKP
jgi:hypothetical protein